MRAASNFSVSSVRRLIYGALVGLSVALIAFGVLLSSSASALSINSSRDCDNNAVIKCGALTINELKRKYADTHGAPTMFSHMGISSQDIRGLTNSNTVEGKVTRAGRVVVGDKTVATGATTVGRQNMPGSKSVTRNGLTFYERTPAASFQTSSLKAFVVSDKDGKFLFAVIASCGNPVKATPVPVEKEKPKPKPTPQPEQPKPPAPQPPAPETPQPAPAAPVSQQQQQQQTSSSSSEASASASVTINNEKPEPPTPQPQPQTVVVEKPVYEQPAPVAAPVATDAPRELPKTGMESVGGSISVAGLVALVSAVAHYLYTRKRYEGER